MAMRVKRVRYGTLDARQEALRLHLPTYISPTPCKRRGHTGPRRTLHGKCIECEKEDSAKANETRRRNRKPTKIPGTSLSAMLLAKTSDLTPSTRLQEPACQPHTTKK